MLFSIFPLALIYFFIFELISAKALLFTHIVSTLIAPAIFPCVGSLYMRFSFFPVAFILEIRGSKSSRSMKKPIFPEPFIDPTITPLHGARALPTSIFEVPNILILVLFDLSAIAMRLIILKVTLINQCTVRGDIPTPPMTQIIEKLTLVSAPIGLQEDTFAIGSILFPIALIEWSIGESLPSIAMTFAVEWFALVDNPIPKDKLHKLPCVSLGGTLQAQSIINVSSPGVSSSRCEMHLGTGIQQLVAGWFALTHWFLSFLFFLLYVILSTFLFCFLFNYDHGESLWVNYPHTWEIDCRL